MRLQLATADDTAELGRRLAQVLRAGDLVILDGPLGAGKTVLVQGIGAGLGVAGPVTSPTFVIARVHQGPRVPLVHVDAYRLGSLAEVDDLDLDTGLDEAVTVVEWGEGKVEHLAEAHLLVRLRRRVDADPAHASPTPDDTRTAELVGTGGDWAARLDGFAATAARPRDPSVAAQRGGPSGQAR